MIIDVTDLNLDSLNIAQKYNPERKGRGNRIYNKRWVKIEEVMQIGETKEYEIKAKVNGNYQDKYSVFLKIKNNVLEEWNCTCEDCAKRKHL